jgi:hypothetical protein
VPEKAAFFPFSAVALLLATSPCLPAAPIEVNNLPGQVHHTTGFVIVVACKPVTNPKKSRGMPRLFY